MLLKCFGLTICLHEQGDSGIQHWQMDFERQYCSSLTKDGEQISQLHARDILSKMIDAGLLGSKADCQPGLLLSLQMDDVQWGNPTELGSHYTIEPLKDVQPITDIQTQMTRLIQELKQREKLLGYDGQESPEMRSHGRPSLASRGSASPLVLRTSPPSNGATLAQLMLAPSPLCMHSPVPALHSTPPPPDQILIHGSRSQPPSVQPPPASQAPRADQLESAAAEELASLEGVLRESLLGVPPARQSCALPRRPAALGLPVVTVAMPSPRSEETTASTPSQSRPPPLTPSEANPRSSSWPLSPDSTASNSLHLTPNASNSSPQLCDVLSLPDATSPIHSHLPPQHILLPTPESASMVTSFLALASPNQPDTPNNSRTILHMQSPPASPATPPLLHLHANAHILPTPPSTGQRRRRDLPACQSLTPAKPKRPLLPDVGLSESPVSFDGADGAACCQAWDDQGEGKDSERNVRRLRLDLLPPLSPADEMTSWEREGQTIGEEQLEDGVAQNRGGGTQDRDTEPSIDATQENKAQAETGRKQELVGEGARDMETTLPDVAVPTLRGRV